MTRRATIGAVLAVLLAPVAVARWTIWRPHRSSPVAAHWSPGRIGRPFYEPSSSDVWNLPRVLRAGHAPGRQVIGVREAQKVAETLWNVREDAAALRDVPMLERLETGPALRADVGDARAQVAARRVWRSARPATPENVVVPAQRSYPAWFMLRAHVEGRATSADPYASGGFEDILILAKSAPGRPWKLAVDVTFDPAELPPGLVGTSGTGVDPAPPSRRLATADLTALGAYYQHWYTHRSAPAGRAFLPGPGTTGQGYHLTGRTHGVLTRRLTTRPRLAETFAITLEHGWKLACGAVRSLTVDRPSIAANLWQPADRSDWGDALAPGDYRRISTSVQRQVCIARRGRRAPMLVYGGGYTLTAVTGTPAGNRPPRAATSGPGFRSS